MEIAEAAEGPTFAGNPQRFRPGVKATRIQVGFQHDIQALAVSNIAPLPHKPEAKLPVASPPASRVV